MRPALETYVRPSQWDQTEPYKKKCNTKYMAKPMQTQYIELAKGFWSLNNATGKKNHVTDHSLVHLIPEKKGKNCWDRLMRGLACHSSHWQ